MRHLIGWPQLIKELENVNAIIQDVRGTVNILEYMLVGSRKRPNFYRDQDEQFHVVG
jgi:hypothetical protein